MPTTTSKRPSARAQGRRLFDLTGRVAVITGGAGLLGVKHAEAIAEMGGLPVLCDVRGEEAERAAARIAKRYAVRALGVRADITDPRQVATLRDRTLSSFGRVDILINNAACNPAVTAAGRNGPAWSRLEQFPLKAWNRDVAVGLTGAFLCSQAIGGAMARRGRGVILNIASDLSVIAPDQRIYRQPKRAAAQQPVKPVSYSVVKTGLLGLSRYLATYWAAQGVRVNTLSPGGVAADQPEEFVQRLSQLIPLKRMAHPDEYKAAVVFLVSDASSYMTGANLVMDGGRSCW